MRLDVAMMHRKLAPSRARAQDMIRAGLVQVAGVVQQKTSFDVALGMEITVTGDVHPWVGRGGMKLAAALDHFGVSVSGAVCLDLGASTGGFTDVLLSRGAAQVFAVDVGHDQLHEKLRGDARVINLEGLHAKDMTTVHITQPVSVIVADVSFISLTKVLPHALPFAAAGALLVALVKPQFEVGRGQLGGGGIVRDVTAQQGALQAVCDSVTAQGWAVAGTMDSPVTGSDGNREFLIYALKS